MMTGDAYCGMTLRANTNVNVLLEILPSVFHLVRA